MDQESLCGRLLDAEDFLDARDIPQALALLQSMVAHAEAYVAAHCPTTDTLQWFSFPTYFERLAYRRVEDDPRELKDVGEPLDRLYADYAYALVEANNLAEARGALAQAVRWNPMECAYRLDLAELYLIEDNAQEWLALSFSVFERASHVEHLVQAYVNFAKHYAKTGQEKLHGACLAAALRLGSKDAELAALVERAAGTAADPKALSGEEIAGYLGAEGIPEGANAEVALCLIMCAGDASVLGDERAAWDMLSRARGLVGDEACLALAEILREADEELAQNQKAQSQEAQAAPPMMERAQATEKEASSAKDIAAAAQIPDAKRAVTPQATLHSGTAESATLGADATIAQVTTSGGKRTAVGVPDGRAVERDEAAYDKERGSSEPFASELPCDDALEETNDA